MAQGWEFGRASVVFVAPSFLSMNFQRGSGAATSQIPTVNCVIFDGDNEVGFTLLWLNFLSRLANGKLKQTTVICMV